ncbi:YdgA family protein [Variovorax sp. dw_308]|uniref:YdgA family protein n=1 Tax=Variovorax sp. dw_308 TaxID=2721546 RepID=UPI001C445389|nr:YdgA family protein [Variovorax sp. dw_308]
MNPVPAPLLQPARRDRWQPFAVIVVGATALSCAIAVRASEVPAVYVNDAGVEYASGGIGMGEAKLMKQASSQWPASFEFAIRDGKRGAFASDVVVTVRDKSGAAVMTDVVSQGPFLVARLQPGRYDVQATLAGRTLNQRIIVRGNAPTHSVFVWPAGTDVSVGS